MGNVGDTIDNIFNSIFYKILDKKMKYFNCNLTNRYGTRKVNRKYEICIYKKWKKCKNSGKIIINRKYIFKKQKTISKKYLHKANKQYCNGKIKTAQKSDHFKRSYVPCKIHQKKKRRLFCFSTIKCKYKRRAARNGQ